MRIVQLLPAIVYGDAVGNDTLAMHEAIDVPDCEKAIYAEYIDERLLKKCDYIFLISELPKLKKDDVLIYHFSTGSSACAKIIKQAECKKVMVYHNITPCEYFSEYDKEIYKSVKSGRQELADLVNEFDYCLADSSYNKEDLIQTGCRKPIEVLPIIIPFGDYQREPDSGVMVRFKNDGLTNFLFVGRIVPNKKHENIIRAFAYYYKHYNSDSRLFLVGNVVTDRYFRRLAVYAAKLGIADAVKFTGSISFQKILAYYQLADVFLCMSEHEGFCVPLVESMIFHKPILAYAAAAVPETLGGAGLLRSNEPSYVAKCMDYLLQHQEVRDQLLKCQGEGLKRFSLETVKEQFQACLRRLLTGDYNAPIDGNTCSMETIKESEVFPDAPAKVEAMSPDWSEIPVPPAGESGSVGWKGNLKKYMLKPAYHMLAAKMPRTARWMRNEMYSCWRAINASRMGVWQREQPYILVDATRISRIDDHTGIQRVFHNVYANMHSLCKNVMPVQDCGGKLATSNLYLHAIGALDECPPEQKVSFRSGDNLVLLDSSWDHYSTIGKIMNKAHANGVKVSAIIHDLFPIKYPELFGSHEFVDIFIRWHDTIISEADCIFCNSRTTADSVADYYQEKNFSRARPLNLHYFPMGADIQEKKGLVRRSLQDFVGDVPIFLMVGTIEPRKGYGVAFEAFDALIREGKEARLLIIGKDGWGSEGFSCLLRKCRLAADHTMWLTDATDPELQWAYQHVSALIAASQDEGFGLPLIEAAYFGTPIIASDISIFREVAGTGADYFKVLDAVSLKEKLIAFLNTEEHPDSKSIRLYSWKESAQAILDIIEGKSKPYKVLC